MSGPQNTDTLNPGTHEAAARILESITDAFFALDHDWRFTYVNGQAERLLSRNRKALLGRVVWDEFPAAVGSAFEREYRRAVAEQAAVSFEEFFPPLDTWFEVRAFPSGDGLSVFFQNVSERRRAGQALRESEERYRIMVEGAKDYAMILLDAGGRVTGWNTGAERILGWTEAETLGQAADFIFAPEDRAAGVPAQELERAAAEGRALDLRWHVRKDGARFFADGVMEALRDGHLRGFAKVLRDATDRKLLEDEREALLAETHARAEREALLNRIGAAIRSALDPQQVLDVAVEAVGLALNADRCYYVAYDQAMDRASVGPEWRRGGFPPIIGEYPMSRFALNRAPDYRAGRTQAVADTAGDPAAQALGLRSLVRVPMASGATLTALSAAMTDGPRAWTPDEVALVEAVATHTQGALETVRARRRERTIAEQLQAALQPPLPEGVPGLALARYYEAALAEAGVGGDFYDVFPLDKGCTVLAVGDLSGKGLAAAAQVATVRNMLRAFLYSQPTLAGAVTDLNRVLALHDLLSGFATLFVGCYDGATGRLAYVNCGQEPALLRRAAAGAVEPLPPTGPVLGAIDNAAFEEQSVALRPGDALAVFTDGVTECGTSRTEMLGIDGVTWLLSQPLLTAGNPEQGAGWLAEALALRLIDGVDAASRGGVARDDVCLLVAVAEG